MPRLGESTEISKQAVTDIIDVIIIPVHYKTPI